MTRLLPLLMLMATLFACKKTSQTKSSIIVTLTAPSDATVASPVSPLRLTWTGTGVGTTGPISYKISVVEVLGTETVQNAFKGNKPFFEKDSVELLTTSVPFTSLPLTTTKYAWQVTAREIGGTNATGTSEIRTIRRP